VCSYTATTVLATAHRSSASVDVYICVECVRYCYTALQVLRKVRTLKKLSTLKLQQLCEALKEEVSATITLSERYFVERYTIVVTVSVGVLCLSNCTQSDSYAAGSHRSQRSRVHIYASVIVVLVTVVLV
jgi:hypothetical protein